MITKEKFLAYESVRKSGKYNMIMDAYQVMFETFLSEEDYFDIINNYNKYYNEYVKAE